MIPVIPDFATVVGLRKPALQIRLQAAQGSACPFPNVRSRALRVVGIATGFRRLIELP